MWFQTVEQPSFKVIWQAIYSSWQKVFFPEMYLKSAEHHNAGAVNHFSKVIIDQASTWCLLHEYISFLKGTFSSHKCSVFLLFTGLTRWDVQYKKLMTEQVLRKGHVMQRYLDDRSDFNRDVKKALKKASSFTDAPSLEKTFAASCLKLLKLITEYLQLPTEEDVQLARNLKE